MDSLDKKLLTTIQYDFPVCSRPYQRLGEQLGISEQEVIQRIRRLKKTGLIRFIAGIFAPRKLGYHSTLCTMEVPRENLVEVVELLNNYLGVTHNYLRDHSYNLWFTLIMPSELYLQKTIRDIEVNTGCKVYNLPALKLFKIKVKFGIPDLITEKHNQEKTPQLKDVNYQL